MIGGALLGIAVVLGVGVGALWMGVLWTAKALRERNQIERDRALTASAHHAEHMAVLAELTERISLGSAKVQDAIERTAPEELTRAKAEAEKAARTADDRADRALASLVDVARIVDKPSDAMAAQVKEALKSAFPTKAKA